MAVINKEDENAQEGWTTIDLDGLDDIEDEAEQEDEKGGDIKSDKDKHIDEDDRDPAELDKVEDKRKSRAQDRIRQLVAEKKQVEASAAAKLAEMEAKLAELEAKSHTNQKTSIESQKNMIESQIDLTKDSLRKAMEDGDADKILELNEKLSDLKMDKRITDAQLNKIPAVTAPQEKKTTPEKQALSIPEEMQYFLDENPWVLEPKTREDRKKRIALKEISDSLIADGYSEDDAEFYDALEEELEKRFSSTDEDDVDYENKKNTSDRSSAAKDVKSASRNRSPVSSSKSRTPVSKRGQVRLSPEERHLAEKLNLTEKQYALRKKNLEDAGEGGWVTIG